MISFGDDKSQAHEHKASSQLSLWISLDPSMHSDFVTKLSKYFKASHNFSSSSPLATVNVLSKPLPFTVISPSCWYKEDLKVASRHAQEKSKCVLKNSALIRSSTSFAATIS